MNEQTTVEYMEYDVRVLFLLAGPAQNAKAMAAELNEAATDRWRLVEVSYHDDEAYLFLERVASA